MTMFFQASQQQGQWAAFPNSVSLAQTGETPVPPSPHYRSGMTLVELIVAMSIAAALAAMAIAFLPGIQTQQRTAQAGVTVEGWLRQAKSRAARDQMVRGLRLLFNNAANPWYVNQCQLLDQPDDFYIPLSSIVSLTGSKIFFSNGINPTTNAVITLDFFNGAGPIDFNLWDVQKGDYLEVNGTGLVHYITNVLAVGSSTIGTGLSLQPILTSSLAVAAAAGDVKVTLKDLPANLSLGCCLDIEFGTANEETVMVMGFQPGNVINVTALKSPHNLNAPVQSHGINLSTPAPGSSYKIIRAPRVAGDEPMQLPDGIVIDLSLNQDFNSAFTNLPSNYAQYGNWLPVQLSAGNPVALDILFSPSGTVITPGIMTDFLALWVRDTNGKTPFELGPSLITVYVRSGLIAAIPPNDQGPDPYAFVKGQ